jgi:hypothetical protein
VYLLLKAHTCLPGIHLQSELLCLYYPPCHRSSRGTSAVTKWYPALPTVPQVFQAYLLLKAEDPDANLEAGRGALLEAACQVWKAQVLNVHISDFHRDVSRCLGALGVQHCNEQLTPDGLFSIDIVLIKGAPHTCTSITKHAVHCMS